MTVLDPESGEEVPADGETVGGDRLPRQRHHEGLLKNPTATAEAFSGGWFRSGDLAVREPDGYVKIKDRAKDVIISGGENISSVEIEDVLYRHPAIAFAGVVARPDEKWGETPCAYVELKPGHEVGEAELIEHCRRICLASRRHGQWCSATCRRPRPGRSRRTSCASAPGPPPPSSRTARSRRRAPRRERDGRRELRAARRGRRCRAPDPRPGTALQPVVPQHDRRIAGGAGRYSPRTRGHASSSWVPTGVASARGTTWARCAHMWATTPGRPSCSPSATGSWCR